MKFFDNHVHTEFSNIRIIDSINRADRLIDKAIEYGLTGICIADHECLGSHIKVNKRAKELREKYPDFTIGLGNEIYLTDDRERGQKYYHFILIAKDALGYRAIKEMSSIAWYNLYNDRGLERVPITKEEVKKVMKDYKGHVIATTACFRAGTKVDTIFGEKNIEDIKAGDLVLNKDGYYESVIEPTSRPYIGDGYKITFLENEIPIECTENHQFLVTTNNKLHSYRENPKFEPRIWVAAKDLILKKGATKHICLYPMLKPSYDNSKSIINREEWYTKLIDSTHIRKTFISDKIIITPEIMRLFGLFIGDGSISINKEKNYYRVNFAFNEEEFDYYWNSFVKKASEELKITWSINKKPENHKIDISSSSIDVVELFYSLFGNAKAETKDFPTRLLHISDELDYELIFGYLLADGYFRTHTSDKIINGEMVATSISQNLIIHLQEELKNLNIRSSIYSKEEYITNGINHHKSWSLTSSNNAWKNINKKTIISHEDVRNIFKQAINHCSKNFIEIHGTLYKKVYIKEKELISLNENVYCLNNTSHSFCCNGIIVHNCIGGELGQTILKLNDAENAPGAETIAQKHRMEIIDFMQFCIETFGADDFYIECAPSSNAEQILVNRRAKGIANAFGLKMCVGSDSHYLNKEDRWVHKSYLNSKDGDREVDDFYEFTYLMDEKEARRLLCYSFQDPVVDWIFECTNEMASSIEFFDLSRKQHITEVDVKKYPRKNKDIEYPVLKSLFASDNVQERYWVNECCNKLKELDKLNDTYLSRLEEEARVKRVIGEKLETCMFAYPNTLQHFIDLFWECGSTVGAGRGSACSGLNHWLLGITQLDPIEWNLPWWR